MTTWPDLDTAAYLRTDAVLTRRVGDTLLVLVRGRDELVQLCGSAAALWDLLSTPMSLESSAEALAEAFAADIETVRADIAPVLDELSRRGALIRLGPSR